MESAISESAYYLNLEEMKKLITTANSLRDRIIIKIFATTGIRRFELRDIDIKDVLFDRRRIFIKKGKGEKSRTVPMNSDMIQDIKFYIGNRKTGKLIISNKQDTISLKQINEVVAKCGKRAGVSHPNPNKNKINPHLFRHSFARLMLQKGMRMEEIQAILGHKSIRTTIDIYGTPGMDTIQESYDKIMEELF